MSDRPRGISLRQVEGFLLAAQALSFTRAAESMSVSQSAFSQLIRELESSLAVRLFDRTTRRVHLTEAGVALRQRMQRGMAEIDEACEEARAISRVERGHLSVGTLASLAVGAVTRSLGELRKSHPGVTVSLREDYNGALLERVAKGEVDFAVCAESRAAAELSFAHLFDDELVAVFRRGHPLARTTALRWSQLAREPLVMLMRQSSTYEQIAASLAAHGIDKDADYEVANMFTALSMVRAGFGITFVPSRVLPEVKTTGLAWTPMQKPCPVRRIGICRRRDRRPSPAALKFEQVLRLDLARPRLEPVSG